MFFVRSKNIYTKNLPANSNLSDRINAKYLIRRGANAVVRVNEFIVIFFIEKCKYFCDENVGPF